MSAGLGLFTVFGALFLSVWLSEKLKVNLGVIALLFAVLLGCLGMGLSTNAIFAHFPTSITMTFILGPMFFGYIRRAGLFDKVANNTMYIFGNRPALLPLAVFVAGAALTACGGQHVAGYVLGAIAFPIAMRLGLDPIIIVMAIWGGSGQCFPWQDTAAIPRGLIELSDPALANRGSWQVAILGLILNIIYVACCYLVFKPKKNALKGNINLEKMPFTQKEKSVLFVLIGVIGTAAVPSILNFIIPNPVTSWISAKFNIFVLFTIGIIILHFMKIEQTDIVVKEDIPWTMIVLLIGTSILIGLLKDVGAIELMSNWLSTSVPAFLVIPMLLLAGGVLTMFTNGLVAAQTLNPICLALAPAMGVPFLSLFNAMWKGTSGPNCTPFSGGGAMALVMCPNEHKEVTSKKMIYVAFAILIGQCLLGFTGLFSLFT